MDPTITDLWFQMGRRAAAFAVSPGEGFRLCGLNAPLTVSPDATLAFVGGWSSRVVVEIDAEKGGSS